MNEIQIAKLSTFQGPKLTSLPKINEENNEFFTGKSENDMNSHPEIEHLPSIPIQIPDPINEIILEKSIFNSEHYSSDPSPINEKKAIGIPKNEKKKGILFMINAFKRAKRFAGNIRKNILSKHYKNMTTAQKRILNDLSDFPREITKRLCLHVKNIIKMMIFY